MSNFLPQLFDAINQGNRPPIVTDTTVGKDRIHHALIHALVQLKQRMRPAGEGNRLIDRVRVDSIKRYRPKREIPASNLTGDAARVATLAPDKTSFSKFQTSGWTEMFNAIQDKATIVILAPTGSGKTEVFVLPIVDAVCRGLEKTGPTERFLMIYPRIELLRDQLSRIFAAVHYAQKNSKGRKLKIPIGMQFSGIAANLRSTLEKPDVFRDGIFQKVKQCPVCRQGQLKHQEIARVSHLVCTHPSCAASWQVSLCKEDHRKIQPHILVTTAESLDRFYLDPRFESYLQSFTGVALDEAHLYHGVYGAHIHQLFERLTRLRHPKPLTRISSSATIAEPKRFIAKLMHGDEAAEVREHNAIDNPLSMEHSGDEYAYFVQATDNTETGITRQNPALIQTIMLLGHGVLSPDERMIAFVDSVDQTQRFQKQITDAESTRNLWRFRTNLADIHYLGQDCPGTSPEVCSVFQAGECWRGIQTSQCCQDMPKLRTIPLEINSISSAHGSDFMNGDVVIATPVLEVGVDDERILATVHYQAPVTGVHGFIQRRGRAGRGKNADAFTVMVLGQTPTEQYYFYRRHRLLHGKYMLPLNPGNPIISHIHVVLEESRNAVAKKFQKYNSIQKALHEWIIERLRACKVLQDIYGTELATLNPGTSLKSAIQQWIRAEKPKLQDRLQLRALTRDLREQAPGFADIQSATNAALVLIDSYGLGQTTRDEVRQSLKTLKEVIGRHAFDDSGDSRNTFAEYETRIYQLWDALGEPNDPRVRFPEQLYDFFETLGEFADGNWWQLNDSPAAIKIILRALYFLHLGDVRAFESNCSAHIDVLIPNVYYGETRLVVVEARLTKQNHEPRKYTASSSFLTSILIPYGITYRYYGSDSAATIDVNPIGEALFDADGIPVVKLELIGKGIDRGVVFEPQKIQIRALKPSEEGTDYVRLCPICFRLHDYRRSAPCHGDQAPIVVKIYPTPITQKSYLIQTTNTRFSRQFELAEGLSSDTLVLGSEVTAYRTVWDPNNNRHMFSNARDARFSFRAEYRKPLGYTMPTTGIVWKMKDLLSVLMTDASLKRKVEAVLIDGKLQELNEHLILETAANMLAKAIAALAGCNLSHVSMGVKPEAQELCVWENIEGGAGISQVFMNTLRTSPYDVYREFLTSVVCAVNLAEAQPNALRDDLKRDLESQWHFPPDDPQLKDVLNDVQAEQHMIKNSSDGHRSTCLEHDGCPACVAANGRSKGREELTSRFVAEAILQRLTQKVTRAELETMMTSAATEGLTPPQAITPEDADGFVYVLVF